MKKLLSLVTVAAIVSGALAFTKGPDIECVFNTKLGGCTIEEITILGTQGGGYKADWDRTVIDCPFNGPCDDDLEFIIN